jgi:hypothetical protein
MVHVESDPVSSDSDPLRSGAPVASKPNPQAIRTA